MTNPIHLSDGAYVTYIPETKELLVTANHHDPSLASDIVVIDSIGLVQLITYLKTHAPYLFPNVHSA